MANEEQIQLGSAFDSLESSLPTLKKRIVRWAIRSVITLAIGYGVQWYSGRGWLVVAAWIYVGVALVVGVGGLIVMRRVLEKRKGASAGGQGD